MKFKGLPAVALAIWAVLSVAVLGQFLYDNSLDPEIEEKFVYMLALANFPISLVLLVVPLPVPLWYLGFSDELAAWFNFTLAGFVQWAVLVPAIFKYMRQASWRNRVDDSG